jgi:phage shock protein C
MEKRLYRSRSNRMIAGVCGGLAEYFVMDPTIVRIIAVICLFIGFFPAVIAYLVMAIVVPLQGSTTKQPEETVKENVQEMKQTATEIGKEFQSTFSKEASKDSPPTGSTNRGISVIGIVIIIVGRILLISTLVASWKLWIFAGPILLIAIGLLIIFARRKS